MKHRFIAKPLGRRWAVYDIERGSYPRSLPGAGLIGGETGDYATEEEADHEAARVAELIG